MAQQLAGALREAVATEYPELAALTDSETSTKPTGKDGWTQKEELGHLIDSASNNHLRFVRAALDGAMSGPGYAQDGWVALHGYNELPWMTLVDFWQRYNLLLVQVTNRIPDERLDAECRIGVSAPVTLRFVIEDYILHMRHHLDHILRRETVRPYPSAGTMV
jgi:hypothetical protein